MRILKRNLAFVLVMAMAIGMMVTANAANVEDYRDANDIKFTEAVDVLTALGILEGENGTFHPERVLTREEGAKIITYLMLGADGADNLSTSVAPFTDVAAGRWSAGFIAYCASQGIVGGYGNGTFGPTDTLTGTQFAKMLLVALGYGVNGEFTGANWEIETNKQALLAGVYEGNLGVNFSNGVKREEAAQYAFNTLANCATVKYSDLTGAYYTGNLFTTEIKVLEDMTNTLGYQLYNLEKLENNSGDEFGRLAHQWKSNAKVLTGEYHDTPDAVYTASVKASKIYADLGLTSDVDADIIVDGIAVDVDFAITKKSDTKTSELILDPDDETSTFIGNGVRVEAYVGEKTVDGVKREKVTLCVINTYLGEVTDVDADKDEVTVAINHGDVNETLTIETGVEYEKEDLVLCTVAMKEKEDGSVDCTLMSVKAPQTVEGQLKAYSKDYITFDGDKYNKAFGYLVGTSNPIDFTNTYALIIDENGYAVGFDLVEEANDDSVGYLYVYETRGSSDVFDGDVAKADVKYLDGEGREIVNLLTKTEDGTLKFKFTHKNNEGKATTEWIAVDDLGTTVPAGFYAYSMESDKVVLKDLDCVKNVKVLSGKEASDVDFDGKKTSYSLTTDDGPVAYTVNSRTVAKVVDKDNNVKTYTGTKNLKFTVEHDETDIPVLVVFVNDKAETTLAKEIYVIGDATSESDAIFAYYNGVTEDIEDDKVQVELFIGEKVEKYVVDSGSFTDKGVYSIAINSDNEVSVKAIDATKYTIKGNDPENRAVVTNVTDDYFTDAEGNHNFAEDCVVYKVNSDGLKEAKLAKNNKIVYILNAKDSNNEVLFAFITASK